MKKNIYLLSFYYILHILYICIFKNSDLNGKFSWVDFDLTINLNWRGFPWHLTHLVSHTLNSLNIINFRQIYLVSLERLNQFRQTFVSGRPRDRPDRLRRVKHISLWMGGILSLKYSLHISLITIWRFANLKLPAAFLGLREASSIL